MKRTICGSALLALALLIGACSSDDENLAPGGSGGAGGTGGSGGTSGVTHTVTLGQDTFQPAAMTINAGDTVMWMNQENQMHTVTSGLASTSSDVGQMFDQPMPPSATFHFTFSTAGTFPYFCRIHESLGMKGTITVQGTGGGNSGGTAGTGGGTGGSGGY